MLRADLSVAIAIAGALLAGGCSATGSPEADKGSAASLQPSSTAQFSTSADNEFGEPPPWPAIPGGCKSLAGRNRDLHRLITESYETVPIPERRRLKAVALEMFASPDHPVFAEGLCVGQISIQPTDDGGAAVVVGVLAAGTTDPSLIERLQQAVAGAPGHADVQVLAR